MHELPLLGGVWPRDGVKDRNRVFNATRQFSFLHISKAGGSTFIKWARDSHLFPSLYPNLIAGQEHGYLFDRDLRPMAQRLVLLRSPRAHVLSMFKECRYNKWGISLWTRGGSKVPHNGTHQHDFEQWVNWYLHPLNKTWLGCYQPWNYQARAMTSSSKNPHNIGAPDTYEPSIDKALTLYLETEWVGITDFYDESLCLLLSRLKTEAAAVRFSESCRCSEDAKPILGITEPVTHGSVSSTDVDVYPELAVKMDRLTAIDKALFSVALRGFLSEIRSLEVRVGHRVLCPHVLKSAEPKLAYVTNVTALYAIS
mmetsp:Transcript_9192/g.27140  ORF Transcript_9192/g.27140 Transcript_9192/m.27140 type:complete len:312 (-) Transcript_9192:351-1286(-)